MKGKVKIAVGHGQFHEVDADIYGIVAVTPGMYDGEVITHVSTGYAMTTAIRNKKKIRKLARMINQHSDCFTGLSTTRHTKKNKDAAALMKTFLAQCDIPNYINL